MISCEVTFVPLFIKYFTCWFDMCETWSLALRMFENGMLQIVCGPNREGIMVE
jgi:hypothetical protein